MIQSLYQLGLALDNREEYTQYFASYADPFAGGSGEAKVVLIDIKNDKVVESLDQEDYQSTHARRYLYRELKGQRGAPLVATGKLYPLSNLDSDKKRKEQRDKVAKDMSRIARSIPDGKSAYFSSTAAKEEGLTVIQRLLEGKLGNKDTQYIYTVRIDGKYLGEIQELRDLLDDEAYTKYYEKSRATGKTCALSQEHDVEVWGRVDTLGFTVNDSTFSRGGFDVATSYRMFPVSKPAVMTLEAAKRFAFSKLSDRFCNLKYVIVPRMLEGSADQLVEIVDIMADFRQDTMLTEKAIPILDANGLLEVLVATEGLNQLGIIYDILFYQQKKAQTALSLHLQDINPSRLEHIKNQFIATNKLYKEVFTARGKAENSKGFQISFKLIRNFFSQGKGKKFTFHPFFYQLLECVFYDQPFSEQTVVATLVTSIRRAFKNDGDDYHLPFRTTVAQAIATRTLLGRLGLYHTSTFMEQEKTNPITLERESFLVEHDSFFSDQPALKGAFLLGCLTSMLTYAQYDHLKSKPFLNKLNNLNLGREELRGLVAPLLNKIQQYQSRKSGGYVPSHGETTQIAAEATTLLIKGDKPSRDDLSFAFATGLVMQDKFGLDLAEKRKRVKDDHPQVNTASA